MTRWRPDWRGAVVPIVALVAAEIALSAAHYEGGSLARPSEIAVAGMDALLDGSMLAATAQTLGTAFAGLAIGTLVGVVVGMVLGLSRPLFWTAELTIEMLRPIPAVALIPVTMLLFGLGYGMEITLVAFTTTWPVLLLTITAVRGMKPRLLEVSRLLGMGWTARLFKIVIWAALPGIFVGFRLALAAALVIAVTIEIAANPLGVGRAMMQAQESVHPALMLAYLIWIGLIGWALNAATVVLQQRWFGRSTPGRI